MTTRARYAATFEIWEDPGYGSGLYRWMLRAHNTRVLAVSPNSYETKSSCRRAIRCVQRASEADVVTKVETV